MKKILLYRDGAGCPILTFMETLPHKLQAKLMRQFHIIQQFPSELSEPHVKHFQIERYRRLFEVREKFKGTLVRVIFTKDVENNLIFLEAFIKTHRRTTDMALKSALTKLQRIEMNPAQYLVELPFRRVDK